MSVANRVLVSEAVWVASPAWVASQAAMDAEALAWLEASRESMRADWDADSRSKDDGWDDGWSEQPASDPTSPPALDDPVSLPLLSYLAQQVPADMSGLGLVVGLGAWQRFTGFSTARMWVYLGELHARFTTPARTRLDQAMATGDREAREKAADLFDLAARSLIAEVACELSWSQLRAQGQVEVALILTTDLVKTLDAVAAGVVEVKKAETIARALARESSDLRTRVEEEVLPHAPGWTIPTLNGKIREAVLRLAPELAAERARWARRQRGVSFHAEPDDMMRLEARIPVEDGVRVRAALDHATATLYTARLPGDDRGINEIRCDVLTGALSNLTATAPAATAPAATAPAATAPAATAPAATAPAATAPAATAPAVAVTTATATATATGSATGPSAGSATRPGTSPNTGSAAGPRIGPESAQAGHRFDHLGQSGSDAAGQPGSQDAGRSTPEGGPAKERARRVKSALRNEIVLTVPLETITGDAEHPGYLARYGPVSAGIARALALDVARDGYWRCAVTDGEHGTLLGLGRSTFSPTYRAPEFLQRFTNLRDQTCDFPTCTIPAAACDYDHTVPWPDGTTCECGGGKRCRNHHRLKHETGWNVKTFTDPRRATRDYGLDQPHRPRTHQPTPRDRCSRYPEPGRSRGSSG